jgi:hypothetical protein
MMKNAFRAAPLAAISTLVLCLAFFACKEPSPLYGKWADNQGNTITFINDSTFVASIEGDIYEGTYTVLANTLSLSCPDRQLVSEWDIRGNMLYLIWTDKDGVQKQLTLYKISN